MGLEIREEPLSALAEHATIPIAFRVERVLDVSAQGWPRRTRAWAERPVEASYEKDYGALKGEGPTRWPKQFDVSNWGLIAAHLDSRRVGGVVIAFNTANVDMLEQRHDLAVLWDLRVRAKERSQGWITALLRRPRTGPAPCGCRQLKVETQNNNVPACHFYAWVARSDQSIISPTPSSLKRLSLCGSRTSTHRAGGPATDSGVPHRTRFHRKATQTTPSARAKGLLARVARVEVNTARHRSSWPAERVAQMTRNRPPSTMRA